MAVRYETRVIPPLGCLIGDWVETQSPSCLLPGEETAGCLRENCTILHKRDIPPLGHDFPDGCRVECSRDGCDELGPYCEVCPYCICREPIWSNWTITIPPTCTDPGTKNRFCLREGCTRDDHIEFAFLDPKGHVHGEGCRVLCDREDCDHKGPYCGECIVCAPHLFCIYCQRLLADCICITGGDEFNLGDWVNDGTGNDVIVRAHSFRMMALSVMPNNVRLIVMDPPSANPDVLIHNMEYLQNLTVDGSSQNMRFHNNMRIRGNLTLTGHNIEFGNNNVVNGDLIINATGNISLSNLRVDGIRIINGVQS